MAPPPRRRDQPNTNTHTRNPGTSKPQRRASPSGYRLRDEHIERALLTGEHAGLLEDYFGQAAYHELREMVQETASITRQKGPRVFILPGIMGSKLGTQGRIFDDVVWIDPIDIGLGNLTDLALGQTATHYEPLGVVLFAYLKLKLHLKHAGFEADFYPFDWRQSIDTLGARLAQDIERDKASEVFIVAHSMGGLVARAALSHTLTKVKRLVMLGTPNYGSFAVPQALRGTYPLVRKVAVLDLRHSPEELANEVFNTFPGLYQMLPWPEKFNLVNLYNLDGWPTNAPRPRQALLDGIHTVQDGLAQADERFFLIAGVNQETPVSLRREGDEFVYDLSPDGDGTVPREFAELPGAKTYYVEEGHGSLANNSQVRRAVVDLLERGRTAELPEHWAPPTRGVLRSIRDGELRSDAFAGRTGEELSQREARHILEEIVSPVSHSLPPPSSERAHQEVTQTPRLDGVVVGRRRQHRIDLRLAYGSITEADAEAYVLGVFRDVEPSGAALVLDQRLDGAIAEFTTRRMFSGNVGEVFMLPSGRHALSADVTVLAGLGPFDRFSEEVQQLVAENVIRTLIRAKIEDFATVLVGAGSGRGAASSLRNLLAGFIRGLRDADTFARFRSITLCEFDRDRYHSMKQELYRLSSTALFDDVEVTFYETPLPPPRVAPTVRQRAVGPEPVYLIVAQQAASNGTIELRSSVLTSGAKATVVTGVKRVEPQHLLRHFQRIEAQSFTYEALGTFGEELAELVLADEVRAVLASRQEHHLQEHHLIVVHDAAASRIPWETLHIDGWAPAAQTGLSRKYVADNLSIAKWLEQRRFETLLDLLLVVNPTGDLPGADTEGQRIKDLFGSHPAVRIRELRGKEATKRIVFDALRSGQYDVIHYAGHASFNDRIPSRSGILCAGREVLSGADLAGVGNLPALAFFNACEAARVRRGAERKNEDLSMPKRIERNVSLAEAFLRGGIANYIGTYWPVGDTAALRFAETFYTDLLNGKPIGAALQTGRAALQQLSSVDWADYVHYGSFHFVLKRQ